MKAGTKTLLFGCHQIIIHPLFTLAAWIKLLKRWPNWRELVCIIIHDWGYWGKRDIDGAEGDRHSMWAANKVYHWGWGSCYKDLCAFHSGFFARHCREEPSRLCWIDKYGTALMPDWLWVFLACLTGEVEEYLSNPKYEVKGKDAWALKKDYNRMVKSEWIPNRFKGDELWLTL